MKEQQPQQKHLNPIPISRSVNCLFIDHLSLFFMFLYVHLMKMRSNGQVVDDLNFRPVSLCSSLTMALFFQTRKFDSTSLGVSMGTMIQHPEYMQQYSYTEDALCYKNHSDIKLQPCRSPYLMCGLVFTLTYSSVQLVQWANGIAGIHARCPAEFYHNQSKTVESTFLNTKIALFICTVSLGLFNGQFPVYSYCSKFLQQGLCCLRPLFLNCYLA